jgi:hypothetical protein
MLRFQLIDNIQPALAADDLVIRTDLLDTCTYFHTDHCLSKCGNDTLLIVYKIAGPEPLQDLFQDGADWDDM